MLSVILHLLRDWAQYHKASLPNHLSSGLCILDTGVTRGGYQCAGCVCSKHLQHSGDAAEVSHPINTISVQLPLFTDVITFTRPGKYDSAEYDAKNETLITMMKLVWKLLQTLLEWQNKEIMSCFTPCLSTFKINQTATQTRNLVVLLLTIQ